uniref:neuronal tyrosine-phosphorylated phosphoinositide-3-kinase adapter 1-like isoform X2 n=1 Tax=Pristiophorus japonicus TaxID=55135 RepID=UPI00398F30D8
MTTGDACTTFLALLFLLVFHSLSGCGPFTCDGSRGSLLAARGWALDDVRWSPGCSHHELPPVHRGERVEGLQLADQAQLRHRQGEPVPAGRDEPAVSQNQDGVEAQGGGVKEKHLQGRGPGPGARAGLLPQALPHGLHDHAGLPGPRAPPVRGGYDHPLAVPALGGQRGERRDLLRQETPGQTPAPPQHQAQPVRRGSRSQGRERVSQFTRCKSSAILEKFALLKSVGQRTSLEGGDGGRRIPPLKPKRSPNTQLSVSFDEASVGRACGGGLGARFGPPTPHRRGSQEEAEEEEEEEEEPVYIEMVGDAFREQGLPEEDSDHSEAIYEEMKYPLLEEGPSRELRWSKLALARPRLPGACKAGARVPPYDIPPPFPNLLLHRPPLLAFPQAPSHKAYKGPPASRLPVLQHGEPPKEEDPANPPGGLAPAGRARSHSTPLPPQASGQHRPEKELPTSQTMAGPGLHPGPQHPAHPKAERDRPPSSVGLACASAKQAAHPPGEPRPDKEPPGLPGLFCSVAKVTRPQSGLFKATAAGRAPPEHPGLPGTLAGAWPYCAPPACKRPPAYDSLKPGVGPKACPSAPQHSTVRTQAPAFASICCSRAIANSEARTAGGPAGEGGSGRNWQRKLSCGRKAKDPEAGGARGWSGGGESLAKEERTSGPPLKAEDPEGASLKGPTRSGLPQPCPMVCQRNEDPTLGHRLGRSASTSGVRQPLAHLQRQSSQSRDSPSQSLHHPQPQGQQGSREKDGKLLEVIERKRCLCKEIKARRRPERSLCKQDSMPILPSWRKAADTRKTGTPPCQRQHTVLWDTAI